MAFRTALRDLLKRLAAAADGTSVIEFAFIAPAIAILIIGLSDFGLALWNQMQVTNAADAGAQYAAIAGWQSSGIQAAVTSATSYSAITAVPAPYEMCGCPDPNNPAAGTQNVGAPPCTQICGDESAAGTYVVVSAQAPYSTILPWPGITSPMNLTSVAYVRIK